MKNKKTLLVLVFALALILVAGLAGGGVWWWQQQQRQAAADQAKDGKDAGKPAAQAKADGHTYKYITLDKVIVMLRGTAGQPVTHYMAVDLVFKTRAEQEKTVKEHLPLLRSVAVRALSAYTMDKAGLMTIDQFAADINKAFSESYQREQRDKPFAEAMIGKLIIE
jgi:flagellar FliL protein